MRGRSKSQRGELVPWLFRYSPFPLACVLLQIPSVLTQNSEVNTRTVNCPNTSPPFNGYSNIQDVINDQTDEWQRIRSGTITPRPPYFFRFCPNTVFDLSGLNQAFSVLLSGSVFSCGPNMASTDNCVLRGNPSMDGMEQILIQDSTVPGYPLQMTSFIGMTLDGFNGSASINAFAGRMTTATFQDVIWQNFNGTNFVLDLSTSDGTNRGPRMQVDISDGSVAQNGNGGSLFSNDRGTLTFEDFTVRNITASSVFAASNQGVTMLDRTTVSDSDVGTVSFTNNAATTSVRSSDVTAMRSVTDSMFSIRGRGSTLMMTATDIHDNLLQQFDGIVGLQDTSVKVTNSQFRANTGVHFGFATRVKSDMELIDVVFSDNTGVAQLVTALTYSDDFSNMTLRDLEFRNNFVFTGHIFALYNGTINTYMTCIKSGGGDQAVFICNGCNYMDSANYISPGFTSTTCNDPTVGRLALDAPGSNCYNAATNNTCTRTCAVWATSSQCVATMYPTMVPTLSPTVSLSPTTTAEGGTGGTGSTGGTGGISTGGSGGGVSNELTTAPTPSAGPGMAGSGLPPAYFQTFSPTINSPSGIGGNGGAAGAGGAGSGAVGAGAAGKSKKGKKGIGKSVSVNKSVKKGKSVEKSKGKSATSGNLGPGYAALTQVPVAPQYNINSEEQQVQLFNDDRVDPTLYQNQDHIHPILNPSELEWTTVRPQQQQASEQSQEAAGHGFSSQQVPAAQTFSEQARDSQNDGNGEAISTSYLMTLTKVPQNDHAKHFRSHNRKLGKDIRDELKKGTGIDIYMHV